MVIVKAEKVKKVKSEVTKVKEEEKKPKELNNDPGAPNGLTPYQGERKCFGLFKCTNCSRQWGSAHSWANMGQECRQCRINVYPRAQWRLKRKRRPKVAEPGKSHEVALCEKCKKIGHSCTLRARSDER